MIVRGGKDTGGCAGEGDVTGGLPWLFHHHPSQVKYWFQINRVENIKFPNHQKENSQANERGAATTSLGDG